MHNATLESSKTWAKCKLIAAGAILVLLALMRFALLRDNQAKWLILTLGYWLIAVTTALFAVFLWRRLCRIDWAKPFWQTHAMGLACALICGLVLQVNEQRGYKVLFDEYVIAGVARNMHFNREAAYPARAHFFNGRLVIIESGVDKRPFFFAFLLSLVHDLSGYREANAFYLNAGLSGVLFLLLYFLGFRIGGKRYGCLGVLLLTTLPLLAQNATGAGFEVINLVMICTLLLVAADYLESPDAEGLDLLVITTVLLAQARYESILYVLVTAAIILCKWRRKGKIQLTWFSTWAPLLLIVPLAVNKIGLSDPIRFQLKAGQEAFALSNISDNLDHAIYYLFAWNFDSTNSLFLAFIGMIAMIFLILLLGKKIGYNFESGNSDLVLTLISIIIIGTTIIELSYYWGHWDDVMVSRFSLPFHLLLVLATLRVLYEFFKNKPLPKPTLLIVSLWILFVTVPVEARHFASSDIVTVQEYNWYRDFLSKKSPAETLSVVASSIAPILQGYPAIPIDEAKMAKWQLKACLDGQFYHEILILQRFRIDPETGKLIEIGPSQLGNGFILQTLAEKHVRPDIISRISRFIDVSGEARPPADFEKEKPPFKDDTALIEHMLRELP